ncbi:S8 family serine peptidase [Conexibacter sp. SYSU D00693]|uniref:S8 family peptidase n=1 Tax=Conexibacter sp. SYSU D00693 TaxID=2812560 RepID=UPI00196A4F8D|nr:S8 family serine peptidase [Conexibacter sp. SYSU D00693]
MELPPASGATARAASAGAEWLLGVRGARGMAAARAAGARPVGVPGAVRLPAAKARAAAQRLRRAGLLTWAQSSTTLRRQSSFDGATDRWARAAVVTPALQVPAPGPAIGIVDDRIDPSAPDVGPSTRYVNDGPVGGPHGTETSSVAAGLANGQGVTGVFPGAPLISYGTDLSCPDVARGIEAVRAAGARVINLSLGGPRECVPVSIAVQRAFAAGVVVVASTGNEFAAGNPVIYPAASPHVLSVSAVDMQLRPTEFSTANAAVDVAAPGVAVPVAVPRAFDDDGTVDGLSLADGTSFSAPMVSGAVAWMMASRPGLDAGQYGDLIREGAVDLAPQGYDADTGYGLLSVDRSLTAPIPASDRREPNDGITFVNGTLFGRTASAIWTGRSRQRFTATTDRVEDPSDVYRIRVPARSAVAIAVRQRAGDADLALYSSSARTLSSRPIDTSVRTGTRTETIRYRNRGRRAVTRYVAVAASARGTVLNARYELDVRRARFR